MPNQLLSTIICWFRQEQHFSKVNKFIRITYLLKNKFSNAHDCKLQRNYYQECNFRNWLVEKQIFTDLKSRNTYLIFLKYIG
jgi:hypothetical protein